MGVKSCGGPLGAVVGQTSLNKSFFPVLFAIVDHIVRVLSNALLVTSTSPFSLG